MDVELVHKGSHKSRFEKWLAMLVGLIAVAAALLATLDMHSNKRWEQASVRGSRLSVEIFGRIAASGPVRAAETNTQQTALLLGQESSARFLQDKEGADAYIALADQRASDRLLELVEAIKDPADDADELDPVARDVLATSLDELSDLSAQQHEQIDEADRYGTRINRANFALLLLALGGVLLGLAAVMGVEGRGYITLVAAGAALVSAVAWGGSALLV